MRVRQYNTAKRLIPFNEKIRKYCHIRRPDRQHELGKISVSAEWQLVGYVLSRVCQSCIAMQPTSRFGCRKG